MRFQIASIFFWVRARQPLMQFLQPLLEARRGFLQHPCSLPSRACE